MLTTEARVEDFEGCVCGAALQLQAAGVLVADSVGATDRIVVGGAARAVTRANSIPFGAGRSGRAHRPRADARTLCRQKPNSESESRHLNE